LSGGDGDKARQLLALYCRSAEDDLLALDDAERRGDGSVARVAHRIKGAALMIGANEVAEIARLLELRATEPQAAGASAPTDQLRQAVARVQVYARDFSA